MTYFNTMGFRLRILLLNLAYFLCQNSLPSIMIYFVNKRYKNNDVIVAISGTNIINNLLLLPIILGLASVIEILGSQSYASKKYYLFGCYMNRSRIVGYCSFILLTVIIFSFKEIYFNMMGYNFYTRMIITQIIGMKVLCSFLDLEYNIMMRYMQITGNGMIGFLFILITYSSFPIYCYLFVELSRIDGIGIGLCYLCLSITNILPVWIYILLFKPNKESIFFFNKHSFEGLAQILRIGLFLSLIMVLDYMNTEMMNLCANFYPKNDNVAFIIAMSIYYFFNSFYLSYNVLTCVCVSFYVGKNQVDSAKKIISYICLDATFIGISLFCLSFPLRYFFVKILSHDPVIIEKAADLLIIFFFVNLVENYMGVLFSTLKGLKRVVLTVILYVISNGTNIAMLLLFKNYTSVGIHSIPLSNQMINFLNILLYGGALWLIDWNEEFKANKQELEHDEVVVNDVNQERMIKI